MKEISQITVDTWLSQKTIKITEYGNENTYYMDNFNNEFYCKNYPENYGIVLKIGQFHTIERVL